MSYPTPFEYFTKCITTQYADFSGRARRSEYWYFVLFSTLLSIAPFILFIIGLGNENNGLMYTGVALIVVITIGLIIPNLAVTVRRLHDTNKSGWYYLFGFIPAVGGLIVFIFMVENGNQGPNNYGPDPKRLGRPDLTDHLTDWD